MLDFLVAPVTTGIVFFMIYKTFELFVRRNERLTIINKMAERGFNNDGKPLNLDLNLDMRTPRFTSLRFGACLLGIGLGMLVGFIISIYTYPTGLFADMGSSELASMIIGSNVLIFGGIAMLTAFLIERGITRKEKNS